MSEPTSVLTHHLEGEGETILFLNGGFMTFGSWEPVARPMRQGYRHLFCDLRGQIKSPGPSRDRLEENVQDVRDLLDHLNIEQVHVLGTSFGGFVGLLFAALHPERVLSVVAATTTDVATPDLVRGVEDLRRTVADIVEGGDAGRFHDLLLQEVYSPEFIAEYRQEFSRRRDQMGTLPKDWFAGLQGIITCTETVDLRPHLGAVRCPTLVIHAARDEVIPRERSEALAAAVNGAELIEHPFSGHALVAEDPKWLAEQCLSFLSRAEAHQHSART